MHSCLYEGRVSHRRFTPRPHAFDYRVFYAYLDLDELDTVFRNRWFWSTRGWAPVQFRRRDHFGSPQMTLKQAVADEVERRTGRRPQGPIRILTHLRHFGLAFNPVSFYYCFDSADRHMSAVVAEVSNTPWGERHVYVADSPPTDGSTMRLETTLDKEFHVSPFMPMNVKYRWSIGVPGRRLGVHMENIIDQQPVFDATLSLHARPISARGCAAALTRFPLMNAKVLGAIYWQAFKLWRKGIPFHAHPGPAQPSSTQQAKPS